MKLPWLLKALILIVLCAGVFGSTGWFAWEYLLKPDQIPPDDLVAPQDMSAPEFERVMAYVRQHRRSV